MAQGTSVQGHKFGVATIYGDGTDGNPTHWIDTHQAVKKPLSNIRFGEVLPADAVKLAYASVDPIDSANNLVITDRSSTIIENARDFVQGDEVFEGLTLLSYYRNLLVTDIFTDAAPTQPVIPLFYVHQLPNTAVVDSISVLDSSLQPVSPYLYKVEVVYVYDDTGAVTSVIDYVAIYNDLRNNFDAQTGVLDVYYVRYRDDTGVQNVLLSNEEIFREATPNDIWIVSMKLKPWVNAYIVEQIGEYYFFTLPALGRYGTRFIDRSRIYALPPVELDNEDPWFLRITNGAFRYTGTSTYIYDIPEFRTQLFNPVEPYKLAAEELVDKVGPGLIKLEHTPTALADFAADLIVQHHTSEEVIAAITSDPLKIGTAYSTTVTWTPILGFDADSGLVYVDFSLKDYHKIYATYYYTEQMYEYSFLNLNPIQNLEMDTNGFYVNFMIPRSTHASLVTQDADTTIYHMKVDKDGYVVSCNMPDNPDWTTYLLNSAIIGLRYGRTASYQEQDSLVSNIDALDQWLSPNCVVTQSTEDAPDSSGDKAWVLNEESASSAHYIQGSTYWTRTGNQYALSVYVKREYRRWFLIGTGIFDRASFDLATGAIGTVTNADWTTKMEDQGNGWYLCTVTFPAESVFAPGLRIGPGDADNSPIFNGQGEDSIHLWHAGVWEDTFLEAYTVESTDNSWGQLRRFMVISETTATETVSPDSVTLLDIRVNGGGIKEDRIDEAIAIEPEVSWYADIGGLDGIPYPAKSAVVVKLPWQLLSDYGGRFTKAEVQEITKRHMGFGHYSLVRYYGSIPSVYLDEDSYEFSNSAKIYWNAESSDVTYNVYTSFSPLTRFTQHNFVAITDNNPDPNYYLIAGLTAGITCYIFVRPIIDGVEGPPSKTIQAQSWVIRPSKVLGHKFNIS